jgi:putative spermidine/putrescine transport system substrate-binding protein
MLRPVGAGKLLRWLFLFAAAMPVMARADGRLVVLTQGSVDKQVREYIVPKMKAMYGIDVSTTPSLSAPALAKAMAQKRSPQIDVFMLDAGPWLQGKTSGLWADIPAAAIPNLADVPDGLKDAKGIPYTHLVIGLLYDSSKLKTPPASLRDLEDPKFKGKLAVPTFSSTFAFALLSRMQDLSGEPNDPAHPMDAGFTELKKVAPNVLNYYGGGAQLVDLFKQGEVEAAWGAYHVAAGLGAESPVKWVAPKEGASLSTVYAAIADGSKNSDAAAKFIDLLLSPEFQAMMVEQAGVAFVNGKTTLSPDYVKSSPLTAEVIANGKQLPWDVFNTSRVAMNERWQRELEAR